MVWSVEINCILETSSVISNILSVIIYSKLSLFVLPQCHFHGYIIYMIYICMSIIYIIYIYILFISVQFIEIIYNKK